MPLFSGRCYSQAKLVGKTAIVTGCNTGIGKETVIDFYKRGARVIMACRDINKAQAAKEDILTKYKDADGLGHIDILKLDLGSLASVRECASEILKSEPKIHLLINNAGVMMCPQGKTEDGFETQIGTNHLGHFLFTMLLLPRLIETKPSRIVTVSSRAHDRGTINFDDLHFEKRRYSAINSYSQSKLANVLFSSELSRKLKEHNIDGVNTYSLHPGVINTELLRHVDQVYFSGLHRIISAFNIFYKTPELGAQTTIYCAVDEKCVNETGLYYSDCVVKQPSKNGLNEESAKKLWDVSWDLVGLKDYDPFKTESSHL